MKPFTLLCKPVVWMVFVLSGCASVGPTYVKQTPQSPAAWNDLHSDSGLSAKASTVDLSRWWQQLSDPLLSSLITQGLVNNPDIHNAQARLREARARRDLAGANRFPTVTGSFSASRSKGSKEVGRGETNNLFNAGFDTSWEPDVFGGLQRAVEAASADTEATQANLYGVQVSLAAEIALNYVDLRSFQSRLAIAQANLATQTETLQITDWRSQAGLATSLDVERARTNREQTLSTLPTLNEGMVEAKNRLAILLGHFPGTLDRQLSMPATLPVVPDGIGVGIPADTLRQRPDVVAAERALAAETARIGVNTARLYPSFSLSGSFGWQALTLGSLGSGLATSVLGNATQTLFDAGRIRSSINIQTAVQEQAFATYQKTILTALEDVENALSAYANNRERLHALGNAREASRNAASLARQQYESGLVDFQQVLDTQRTLLSIEDSLASTEAGQLFALISLYRAMGGGWTEIPQESKQP